MIYVNTTVPYVKCMHFNFIYIIPTESISFSSFPCGEAGLLGLQEDGSSFSFPSGCGGAVNFVKPPIIIGTSPLAKVVSCPVTSICIIVCGEKIKEP